MAEILGIVIVGNGRKRPALERWCPICGKPFWARLDHVKNGHGKYCSLRCAAQVNAPGNGAAAGRGYPVVDERLQKKAQRTVTETGRN